MNHTHTRNLFVTTMFAFLLLQGCSPSTPAAKEPQAAPEAKAAPPATTSAPVPAAATAAAQPAAAKVPVKSGDRKVATQPQASTPTQTTPAPAAARPETTAPQEVGSTLPSVPPAPSTPPPPPAAPIHVVDTKEVVVPAGTEIAIRMIDSVDAGTAHVGDTFRASIDSPLMVNNEVVLPKGGDVYVKVTLVAAAGDLRGKSELKMELDHLIVGKQSYTVESNAFESEGVDQSKKTVRNGAIGAAIGAAVGAIAGGGKGAAIGAGAGAGGGVGATVLMKGNQVQVPSETRLVFTLTKPVQLTVPPAAALAGPGPARLDSSAPIRQDSQPRVGFPSERRRRF